MFNSIWPKLDLGHFYIQVFNCTSYNTKCPPKKTKKKQKKSGTVDFHWFLVSFFSEENVLSDETKTCSILE